MALVSLVSSTLLKVVTALFTLTKLSPVPPRVILNEKSLIQFLFRKISPTMQGNGTTTCPDAPGFQETSHVVSSCLATLMSVHSSRCIVFFWLPASLAWLPTFGGLVCVEAVQVEGRHHSSIYINNCHRGHDFDR